MIPLAVAFGFPQLLKRVGEGPVLQSLDEREYNNDEQIDNSLRSILFQVPKPGVPDPSVCGEPVVNPDCFTDIADLGADDIQRGRDHGMPTYNQMRRAYGLPAAQSFTDITGESTDRFPRDPLINQNDPINDPNILDFISLKDDAGNPVAIGNPDDAVSGTRRSTIAARLKAIYGNVNKVDAFVGMVAEPHVAGTEFGKLQLAIWKKQFAALRDGDRFFYRNDPVLRPDPQVVRRHVQAHAVGADRAQHGLHAACRRVPRVRGLRGDTASRGPGLRRAPEPVAVPVRRACRPGRRSAG